ncbi:hypothetical protein DFH09DRAFT_953738, partial [Mycena vulgaris]
FTTQCLARVRQHLPVTQLETATLAFAVVNIFIWSLWWKKPLDVDLPIPVGPVEEPREPGATTLRLDCLNRFFGALLGSHDYDPMTSASVPSFWAAETHNVRICLDGGSCGGCFWRYPLCCLECGYCT